MKALCKLSSVGATCSLIFGSSSICPCPACSVVPEEVQVQVQVQRGSGSWRCSETWSKVEPDKQGCKNCQYKGRAHLSPSSSAVDFPNITDQRQRGSLGASHPTALAIPSTFRGRNCALRGLVLYYKTQCWSMYRL